MVRAASYRQVRALFAMVAAAGPSAAHEPLPGAEQMSRADRGVVDKAVTVLVEEGGASAEEAVQMLQLLARSEAQDLVGVARVVVADARERRRGIVVVTD